MTPVQNLPLLAIDARNASVQFGVWNGEEWGTVIRLSPDRSADEYALFLRTALGTFQPPKIGRAFIASVVPALTPRLQRAVQTVFGCEPKMVGPGIRTGIRIRTDVPSELGADIVCSAVAARALTHSDCIVVDFATAISFSAVSASGDLAGVAIAPGIESAIRGLRSATAQLPDIPLELPPEHIGRTTIRALQSGVMYGYSGLVKAMIHGFRSEFSATAKVIVTGNEYGRQLLAMTGLDAEEWRYVPDLALSGMVTIAGLNERD